MIISTSCPNCGKKLNAPDVLLGQTIKCPKCRAPITVADQPTLEPGPVADVPTVAPTPEVATPTAGKTQPQEYGYLAPPQAPDEIGRLGPYRILRVLGTGGMGVVFQAEDINLRRTVALKAMKPEVATNPVSVKRFLREARVAASIEHDHIVAIYQVGDDRGVPYLAMQFLRGESLEARLSGQRKLPFADVLRIGKEIARGLGAAHDQGLIHRDIKPANIWLEANTDRVKIVDFGLARETDGEGTLLTQPGAILGTPAYMAPEQARAEPVDARCDLYSLGCVLYRMSTGRIPFTGKDSIAMLLAVTKEPPRPMREFNPDLPPAFSDLVMRLLSKKPADRLPTAKAVVEALEAIEKQSTAAPSPGPSTLPPVPSTAAAKSKSRDLPAKPAKPTPQPAAPKTKPKNQASPPAAKPKTPTAPAGSPQPNRSGGFAVLAFVLLLALGGAAYLILVASPVTPPTPGVLVVHSDDPNIRVIVLRQGQEVKTLNLTRETQVSLEPGEYEVRLAPEVSRRTLTPSRFTLAPGGHQDVYVRGIPVSAAALVRQPAFVHADVRSWTLETIAARGPVYSVAYHRDGRWLASAGADGTVRIWESATGRLIRALLGHEREVLALAWSPAKEVSVLASAGQDNTVLLWNAATGQILHTLAGHEGAVRALAWSPDGKTLASAGMDNAIRFWEAATGNLKRTQKLKDTSARTLAWSPDGKLITFDQRNEIQLVEAENGGLLRTLKGHTSRIAALAWSPKGNTLASAGEQDRAIRLWVKNADAGVRVINSGLTGWLNGLAWSPDNEVIVAVSEDWGFRRWRTNMLKPFGFPQEGSSPLKCVAWSPDGKTLLFGGRDGSVRMWDPETGKTIRDLPGLAKEDNSFVTAWSPDSKQLAIVEGNTVRIRSSATGQIRCTFPEQGTVVAALAWSPDGTKLALGGSSDGSVRIWDAGAAKLLTTAREAHADRVRSVTWSHDGKKLASAGFDKTVRLWNAQTGQLLFNLHGHTGPVWSLSWSPDDKTLASGSEDRTVRFWDAVTGKLLREEKHAGPVHKVSWSPDGKLLASGSGDQTIRLWNPNVAGKPLHLLKEDLGQVHTLCWQPDSKTLLSLDQHRQVRFWDVATAKPERGVAGAFSWGTFSSDGRWLASRGGISFTSVTCLWESGTGRILGTIVPLQKNEYVVVGADGFYCGSPDCSAGLVVVVRTKNGQEIFQETLSPSEFAQKYDWKNDPKRVHLVPVPRAEVAQGDDGWVPLFNGDDLAGWKVLGGKPKVWGVEHEIGGENVLLVNGPGGGWLLTEREYSDFELRLEYKLSPRAQSGVGLRIPPKGNPPTQGLVIPILDDSALKNLVASQNTGALYDVTAPAKAAIAPAGQWNRMHVRVVGRKLTVTINDTVVLDVNLDSYQNRADKYPGLLRNQGHIGLKSQEGRVEFRKIEVKEVMPG